ncbi:MAG: hypothetical protein FWD31_11890, partial [Planctomycetaceae bacterium]|nr:hypothetical protein [Planctomycetaceae bacterium]
SRRWRKERKVFLVRIKSWFGVIKATNQRPTGAEKLQTNFQTGLKSLCGLANLVSLREMSPL